jgi:hypothetical protein
LSGSPPNWADLNVAFKDQLMALEWIRDHIAQFGGDPDKIVLVGHVVPDPLERHELILERDVEVEFRSGSSRDVRCRRSFK